MGLGKTLSEIEHVSYEEFVGWQAFYHFEPWGCQPADQRADFQMQLFHMANKKNGATTPIFIERDPKPEPPQTTEQLEDNIRAFFGARGTVVKKARKTRKRREQPSDQAPISNENGGKNG